MTETKKCTRCGIEKGVSEFGTRQRKMRNGDKKVYHSIYCKSCVNSQMKEWKKQHPEKAREYNSREDVKVKKKEWAEKNAPYESRKEYFKQHYLDNKEEIKKYWETPEYKESRRRYKRKRRNQDPIFRMRENISNAILKALKKGKSDKAGQSIMRYLGYTIDDLKTHLEKQFDSNMSWENYGSYWHIDHKTPRSDLPFISMTDDNFKECWKLDNLRPLEAKQNMIDGSTRVRHKKG